MWEKDVWGRLQHVLSFTSILEYRQCIVIGMTYCQNCAGIPCLSWKVLKWCCIFLRPISHLVAKTNNSAVCLGMMQYNMTCYVQALSELLLEYKHVIVCLQLALQPWCWKASRGVQCNGWLSHNGTSASPSENARRQEFLRGGGISCLFLCSRLLFHRLSLVAIEHLAQLLVLLQGKPHAPSLSQTSSQEVGQREAPSTIRASLCKMMVISFDRWQRRKRTHHWSMRCLHYMDFKPYWQVSPLFWPERKNPRENQMLKTI